MIREAYVAQLRLLLRILPVIAEETMFALKGGTAINLFYIDSRRVSKSAYPQVPNPLLPC